MAPKERVLRAFKKIDGLPDRAPLQFDLCKQHIEHFAKELHLKPEYALGLLRSAKYVAVNIGKLCFGSQSRAFSLLKRCGTGQVSWPQNQEWAARVLGNSTIRVVPYCSEVSNRIVPPMVSANSLAL